MLRVARSSDAKAIAALHAASWQLAYRGMLTDDYLDHHVVADREALWEERCCQPALRQHVLVACEDDSLIGFACIYLDEDPILGCLLDNIHVDRRVYRQRLGSRLLNAAAGLCNASAPGSGLYLSVLEGNLQAQRFYFAHGAENVGTEVWDAPDGQQLLCFRLAWSATRLPVGP
jgi:GNAT superfamily N-acetyltransferase